MPLPGDRRIVAGGAWYAPDNGPPRLAPASVVHSFAPRSGMDVDVAPCRSADARLLTFEQALALSLVTHRGLTYREVAERMGRAPSEVLRLLGEALHCLSERLLD